MNHFFTRFILVVWVTILCSVLAIPVARAQAVFITSNVSPSANLCTGSTISLPFSTTGTFSANNVFLLQRSDENGGFTSPVTTGTLVAAPTSATTLTLSGTLGTTPYGTGYRFRVASSNPAVISTTTTPSAVTIGTPLPIPGQSGSYTFCANSGLQPISASGTGTINWYDGLNEQAPIVAANTRTYNVPTTGTPLTYYATNTVGSCASAKVAVIVYTIPPPTNKPNVTYTKSPYCPTSSPPTLSASLNGGASLRWYVSTPSVPASTTTATTPAAPTTTGLYAYTVVQLNAIGCEGPAETFSIRVYDAAPVQPTVQNPNPSFCRSDLPTVLVASLTGTGTSVFWTGPGITTPINSLSLTLPTTAQPGSYLARQENANGCQGDPLQVNVKINERPLAPDVKDKTVCQNDAVTTLTATAGGKLTWYVQGSATPLPAAPSPSTSTPNSQTVYQVTQTDNNVCVSPLSKPLTFAVRALPDPPKQSASYAYCQAQAPASLTAQGNALKWYDEKGTYINTTVAAPTVPNSYTYKVTQTDGNGCESAPLPLTVIVKATPGPPTTDYASNIALFCQGQASYALQAKGNDLTWWYKSISGSGSKQAPSPSTTSQDDLPYYVTQTSTEGCPSSPLLVIARVNAPPTAPKVVNVSVCQNDPLQTLTATASGSLTWYVQGSTTALPAAPRPSTSTPNSQTIYEVTQTDGNGCVSPRSNGLTFAVRALPNAPTLSNSYAYCQAQAPASLTAQGNALKWYDDGGNFLGNNTIAAPTTAKSYSYKVTQTDATGCQSAPLPLTVIVKATPVSPTTSYANNVALFCQGQASYALQATGNDLTWYTSINGAGSKQAPSPATTGQGDLPYYVTQTSAEGCQSSPLLITARVTATPPAPTSAQSRTYCAGDAVTPLSATEPGVLWYATATAVTGSTQAPRPSTDAANVGTPQLFYVSQTVSGCESQQRQQVSVTVKRTPGVPTNISSPAFCQTYAPSSLTVQPESGATLIWVTNGVESTTAPVPPSDIARSYTYQVLQTLNGCRSTAVPVTVQVKPTPGLPTIASYSLCQGRDSRALQASGIDLKYYDANDLLLGNTAPLPLTNRVTTVTYKVSQSLDGCEGQKITYNVPVNAVPANPTFTQPRDYCAEDTPSPLVASGQSLLWYNTATGGTGSGQVPTPGTTAANVGASQQFYVTQTVSGCESERQLITVTVKRKPALPTTATLVEFCQTYAAPTLTATPEANASIIWLVDGQERTTGPTPPSDAVKTYTYQVLQTLNGCRSNAVTVSARVKLTPVQPAITSFELCQLSPGQPLQASGSAGTTLNYYDANDSPLGTTVPVVPTSQPGTVVYKVSQTLSGCEGPKINYPVVVQPKPAPPVTQAVSYCLESSNNPDQVKQTVQPLTAQGQNLRWYFVDGNPFAPGVVPTPSVGNIYSLDYRVTQTVNNCISDQALLRVTVSTTPAPVVSASVVTYCRNEQAQPLPATGVGLRWIDPNGQLLPASAQNPVPPTNNATKANETYQVYAVSNSGCASPRNSIRLVVNTNPTLSLLGSTTVNYGQSAPLRLRFTSSPPYAYTLTDGTAGIATDTLASVSVKPLQTTTYRVASVSNVCGNGLPGNPATATIYVNIPAITTQALATATVCAGTSFAVSYVTSGTFNAGNAFRVQIADTTSKNYIDVSTPGTTGDLTANLPRTLKGGPYFVRVVATNPGAELPGLPSPSILTVRGLPAAVLSGTQSVFEGSPASLSIALSGDGPWSISYGFTTDGSQPATSTFQTNANPHILSVQPPKTASYFLTAVSNNCSSGPVSGTALVTVMPILAVENPLLNTVSLYPTPTQNLLTVAVDLPLTPREPAQLTLHNLRGLPVLKQQTDTRQTVLDLSQQPAGLYLLTIQVGEHQTVRKVMKL